MVVFSRWDLALNFINKFNTDHIDTLSVLSMWYPKEGQLLGKARVASWLSSEMFSAKYGRGRVEAEKHMGTEDPFAIDCFKAQSR